MRRPRSPAWVTRSWRVGVVSTLFGWLALFGECASAQSKDLPLPLRSLSAGPLTFQVDPAHAPFSSLRRWIKPAPAMGTMAARAVEPATASNLATSGTLRDWQYVGYGARGAARWAWVRRSKQVLRVALGDALGQGGAVVHAITPDRLQLKLAGSAHQPTTWLWPYLSRARENHEPHR